MGRYRAPEPPKTAIITPRGSARLRAELSHLWKVKRPEVTARVAAAAALGDRSENADYHYGKRQLAEIDGRIRYLDKRLRTLQVVDRKPTDEGLVYFGAWVWLEPRDDLEQQKMLLYRIVGPDEIDDDPAYISIDSPMAKALVGRRCGQEVSIVQRQGDSRLLTFNATTKDSVFDIVRIFYGERDGF
ncbi:MAG: transcription elongation factor GreB [OM182 bacterium]|nr:MAG: transcription elongation factor GreB [OM182 bacterium]